MCVAEVKMIEYLQLIIPSIISLIALVFAIFIPYKIMVNQIYADLIANYRSPEMGAAILALFDFYKNDCNCNVSKIEEKYKERYKREIKLPLKKGLKVDFSDTLHFQRRMAAQFYFNMAALRFSRCFLTRLPTKEMKMWFRPGDIKLLGIILHMSEPASKMFIEAGSVPEPPEDDVQMNKLIGKLYEKVSNWQ